jgi:hypothetical protein
MIKIEALSTNALRITAPEKLKADDFSRVTPQIDSFISQHGTIRLLIDATGFNGWENIEAFENHAGFVRNHQMKVERIAVNRRPRLAPLASWRDQIVRPSGDKSLR